MAKHKSQPPPNPTLRNNQFSCKGGVKPISFSGSVHHIKQLPDPKLTTKLQDPNTQKKPRTH